MALHVVYAAHPVPTLVVYAATESRPRQSVQSVTHVLQQRAAPV